MASVSPTSRIKPRALRPGDKVGIVAPASNVKREMLEAGCDGLRRAGYEPFYLRLHPGTRSLLCRFGRASGAGTGRHVRVRRYPRHRLRARRVRSELPAAGARSDEDRCASQNSGGLQRYYDAGVLHRRLGELRDLPWPDGGQRFRRCRWRGSGFVAERAGRSSGVEIGEGSGARPLVPGQAEGMLYGGCLSMLVASLGTPHEIRTAGTILFIEDIAAKPFQIDRMLMQLKLAGKLKDVRGIVFGEMLDCRQSPDQDYTLEEVVLRIVGDLRIPVAFGLRSGHVSRANITLPIGVRGADSTVGRHGGTADSGGGERPVNDCNPRKPRHIHLIGICGTAMASLAGMLQERGFRVTGSDAAAYPPMSTFLETLGIPVAQPFAEANLDPGLIWWSWATRFLAAMSNWSACSTSAFRSARCRRFCTMSFWWEKRFWWSRERMAKPPRPRCWRGSSKPPAFSPHS